METRFDAFFHDSAIVHTARDEWQHVSLVALDPGIPGFVSRRQALPLYALAAQRLFGMGASAVFMDAVLYEYDHRTSYAMCIEEYQQDGLPNQFRWQASANFVPFDNLSEAQFQRFFIARPQFAGNDDFITINLLQNYFGETLLPVDFFQLENNTQQLQRLIADASVHKRSEGAFNASFRWMNLAEQAVIPKVTKLHSERLKLTPDLDHTEQCEDKPCKRIRFSLPKQQFSERPEQPLIPLSELVSCSSFSVTPELQQQVKDRVVILQLTEPTEATDIKVTPMLSAFASPRQFISGPQFLADAVETAMQGDAPVRPALGQRLLLILMSSFIGVLLAAYARTAIALTAPLLVLTGGWLLCFVTIPAQLWPVTASVASAAIGTVLILATHISLGTAKAKLMAQYIPPQIRSLLLKYKGDKKFVHKHIDAVILMSDIAKYSNVTSELKDPAYVFHLLNQYFEETTLSTQNQYSGWLESYVGDMVCFYWPVHQDTTLIAQQHLALRGAVDMARRQQHFFNTLAKNKTFEIPAETLTSISGFIGAGIGLTSGQVMMGNLGPQNGIQKFGCLGDPLNLASRVESLTRYFNTEILITEDLVKPAQELELAVRFIANVVVKGRNAPIGVYALGERSDPRFAPEKIDAWVGWQKTFHEGTAPPWPGNLEDFTLDKATLEHWQEQGLWDAQQACYLLKEK
ncbi:hypothetical protein MACH26_38390 [Planctobacterium marinum]|uniref:Guanylate cyclase domain-containing protein n=2 Tax=Planctobacterium marinum TaxID=1631968 RepID=A0AA48HK48_9ALTE|nr:hypothetical protein MACH26_38390 [Planctobacterium marinum]